jgi:uncharacterized membrane protein YbhN (UPF0104 family)
MAAEALSARPWWPAAKRSLTLLFFGAVIVLLARQARTVDWPAVLQSIRAYPVTTLLSAAALAAASHAVYCTYDLIGRHQTGHRLSGKRVAGIGFVSYAFNLNLGALVGGFAFRFRLYSRRGLAPEVITQILVLSLLTNWLGYLFVGGLVFALHPIALPPEWKIDSTGLRIVGAGMLAAALAYLALCRLSKRRTLLWRGRTVRLPSARLAALQLGASASNWLLIGAVVYQLLPRALPYPDVLSVLLVAAIAGVIAHVPAGLGVLEAVFVALLSHRVAAGELLAALIVYRALYYLVPLALATTLFLAFDRRAAGAATQA